MNFIKIKEVQEIFKDDKHIPVELDVILNLDNITLIRDVVIDGDTGLNVYLIGREKAIRVVDKDDIKLIKNKCGLNKLKENV